MAEPRKSKGSSKKNSSMTEESGSKSKKQEHKKDENVASWGSLRSLFSCRNQQEVQSKKKKINKKIRCSVSLCRMRDSSSVSSPAVSKKLASTSSFDSSSRSLKTCNDISGAISTPFSSNSSASITASSASSSSSSLGGSFGAMHLRGFSGFYECHAISDPLFGPSRDPSMRLTISPCPDCGEIFMNPDQLELHQTETHAVSELAAEDSSRNIIEIIFLSSWLKKQTPLSRIDRILKVHNSPSTISRFEDYRDSIKRSATKHPRCVADGNELLRFYCTTSACPLGRSGATNLCQSTPHCSVCSILRDGFKVGEAGKIQTMATSGGAHVAAAQIPAGAETRAMLVCRVIAGRVKRSQLDAAEDYDSIAGTTAGICANVDELFVFSPCAILPCFVVIYRGI